MIISISFSCKYTEKWYFFLFFNEKIGKNKEKQQFSVFIHIKLKGNMMKHFYFINVEKKSRILKAVTRLEDNSLLSNPLKITINS